MTRPPTTLHVSDQSRSDLGGQQSLLGLVTGLEPLGFSPRVLVPGPGSLTATLDGAGVPWTAGPLGPRARGWLGLGRRVAFFRREIRRWRPAVIHADRPVSALAAGIACRGTPTRAVWHVRVRTPDPRLDRIVPRWVHAVVVTSRGVLERLAPPWRQTARVVHNGIDLNRFRPTPEGPEDPPLVGTLGQLIPLKGADLFFRAAAIVATRVPGARFVAAGDGDPTWAEHLRRLAARAGPGARLLPAVDRPEAFYPRLTAFVLATRPPGEGFGRVVAEAMACGVPVVCTRVDGLSELVESGRNGLLVPPRADEIAGALLRILSDPERARRLGEAGRRRARERFSLEVHRRHMARVFRRVARGEPPCAGDRDR